MNLEVQPHPAIPTVDAELLADILPRVMQRLEDLAMATRCEIVKGIPARERRHKSGTSKSAACR